MAATSDAPTGLLNLEKELVCFICTEVLFQPLTLIDCLHTFCGSCLKEWFSHQHKKASQSRSQSVSNPYTCPTCRATVKDARHNATVTTLLDMFLTANPSRGRTEDEKEEMRQIYRAGEDILPKVETRRRERRDRRQEEAAEAHDRRMIEDARERSLRDLRNGNEGRSERLAAPSSHSEHSRSRDREDRRRRDQERAERRRRAEAAEEASASGRARTESISSGANATGLAVPPTSPRHPDAVEARQRDRTVAHQASLRSLVSASESGTGTGDSLSEARIMQEILAEGLLDGINIDELTEAEQDELSERIAELYRQMHPQREQRSRPQSPPSIRDSTQAEVDGSSGRSDAVERQRRQRSRSNQGPTPGDPRPIEDVTEPQQRPRVAAGTSDTLFPPAERRTHRRRASEETRRQTSPTRASARGTSAQAPRSPAARSATDLSNAPRSSETVAAERVRQLSETRRINTEPAQASPKASEVWQQGGVDGNRSQASSRRRTDSPPHSLQTSDYPHPTAAMTQSATDRPPLPLRPVPTQLWSEPLPSLESTHIQRPATPPIHEPRYFNEPSVSCRRCSCANIQYDVHRHCSQCNMDLCVQCYRAGRGCNHWFGFGRAAMIKFEASAPSRSSRLLEPPHKLVGRQYQRPEKETIIGTETDHATNTIIVSTTISDPAERLQEGHFCDRCSAFANACFWSCEYCNDGEWGFCNNCVDTHHCCTHPLLPVAIRPPSIASPASPTISHANKEMTQVPALAPMEPTAHTTPATSRPSTSHSHSSNNAQDELLDYILLDIRAHCDLCGQYIPPSHSRYHCPSHSSSTAQHNLGGYDICTVCYHNLARSGHVKRDDGPAGWRKCPSGHRMIVIVFEMDSQGNQRRVIMNDLVGGWKCTDDDIAAWKSRSGAAANDNAPPIDAAGDMTSPPIAGKWSWREDASGKRTSRARTSTLVAAAQPLAQTAAAYPPDGGYGKRSVGLWSYYPEEGEGGKGELLFPKGAEVCEVEDVNGEWWDGVYAGERGVFPAVFVREI